MISRHARVQDKKATRKGLMLIMLSLGLLATLFFFGIPALSKFAGVVIDLKGSSQPIATEDKTPPGAPQFTPAPPATHQEAQIELTVRAEAGSTLKIFHNDNKVKETLVDETSSFRFELSLEPGANNIWATATDSQGNESAKSSTWKIVYDTQAPNLQIFEPADGATISGTDKTLTVKGSTEKNTRVKVNERLAIVSPTGEFSQKIILQEGENTITVTATDEGDNTVEKILKVTYTPFP